MSSVFAEPMENFQFCVDNFSILKNETIQSKALLRFYNRDLGMINAVSLLQSEEIFNDGVFLSRNFSLSKYSLDKCLKKELFQKDDFLRAEKIVYEKIYPNYLAFIEGMNNKIETLFTSKKLTLKSFTDRMTSRHKECIFVKFQLEEAEEITFASTMSKDDIRFFSGTIGNGSNEIFLGIHDDSFLDQFQDIFSYVRKNAKNRLRLLF